MASAQEQVANSVRRYRSAHRRYERRHPEIFNPIEQQRLRNALGSALAGVSGTPARALDVGCGSGNVTRHLLELGLSVTAADVSPEFLKTIRRRFGGPRVETLMLNGIDLEGVNDEQFDIVTAYSVLHHIPDYLAFLAEVARVLRPGGIVYLDHEVNDHFWERDGCVSAFHRSLAERQQTSRALWNPVRRRWQRYLMPSKYALGLRLLVDPEYLLGSEGDIHVWREDHIEWDLVAELLVEAGLEVLSIEDYLHYSAEYADDIFEEFRAAGCTDMRTLVARRRDG